MQETETTQKNAMTQTNNHDNNAQCEEPIPDTLRMIAPEDAARATLHGVACDLGHDEVRVLTRIAERIRDARTFRSKEAREELEDALVYLACAWLKAEAQSGVE
jgi:hypothetical protein